MSINGFNAQFSLIPTLSTDTKATQGASEKGAWSGPGPSGLDPTLGHKPIVLENMKPGDYQIGVPTFGDENFSPAPFIEDGTPMGGGSSLPPSGQGVASSINHKVDSNINESLYKQSEDEATAFLDKYGDLKTTAGVHGMSREKYVELMKGAGYNDQQANEAFDKVDANNSRSLDKYEITRIFAGSNTDGANGTSEAEAKAFNDFLVDPNTTKEQVYNKINNALGFAAAAEGGPSAGMGVPFDGNLTVIHDDGSEPISMRDPMTEGEITNPNYDKVISAASRKAESFMAEHADVNVNGEFPGEQISKQKYVSLLQGAGYSKEGAEKAFDIVDLEKDGTINFYDLTMIFAVTDADRSGGNTHAEDKVFNDFLTNPATTAEQYKEKLDNLYV